MQEIDNKMMDLRSETGWGGAPHRAPCGLKTPRFVVSQLESAGRMRVKEEEQQQEEQEDEHEQDEHEQEQQEQQEQQQQ